ncbi:MAG: tetratricopeptide repeat protein [Candidatus Hodarchaeales archaeon]|jgi:tetratricopeptide (TPR) repeat protein
MSIPELLLHHKRIPSEVLHSLLKYAENQYWDTKDFHQIAQDLEEFIHNLPSSEENLDELWSVLIKFLFFAGDLRKLNDVYTSITASNQDIPGVRIFYALALTFQGHSEEGLRILENTNINEISDPQEKLEALGIYLFFYSIRRDQNKVDDIFQEIIHLSETIPQLTERQKAHLLPWAYIRKAYSIRGQTALALDLLNKVQSELNIFPHRFFQIMTSLRIGHIYHISGDFTKAIELYDQAIDLAMEVQSWHLLSMIYNRVGFILTAQRKLEESRGFFQDSLDYANKSGARWLTVGPLVNLIRWKLNQGKVDEAIEDYHTFAKITESVGDEREQLYALLALAELYSLIDDMPKSKYYYSKGVKLGLKLGLFRLVDQSEELQK